ncbi:hypothetical protein [[Pseudopropionibacterium] massiliense]|uniref:hypothetical protein n=1 Tax=[Pseudopropionibacterium] massiliense TaxID=2220000 RepID=UPI0010313FB5|nr:hypothetical protein [[Pseudopropionibacterium] massiliense]
MDGMNIVAGDLESLAQSSASVAEDIVAKKVEAAFGDASSAMPGSESSKLISETGDTVDKRIRDLSERYTDFTEKVKASLHEYQQNEGSIQGAMNSVGSSSAGMGGVGAAASAGAAAAGAAAGKIANRMGGGADKAGDGVVEPEASLGGHSYGKITGGSSLGGHSYGTVGEGSAEGFLGYGSPGTERQDAHSYGSAGETSADGDLGYGSPGTERQDAHSYGSAGETPADGYLGYGSPGSGDSGLLGGSDGPVVEPIPTSPGDYSIDPIPKADTSGPTIENLSATSEGMA